MAYVSVIVLCYNQKRITQTCIRKLEEYTSRGECEIIVVDNGSTDGIAEWLKSRKRVRLIRLDYNSGVIAGRNIGLRSVSPKATHTLFFDNDQFVSPRTFNRLLSVKGDVVGIVGFVVRGTGFVSVSRNRNDLFYVGGGGMLVKAQAWATVGFLDESLGHSYYEDVDICKRFRAAGYKIALCVGSGVKHLGHRTLSHIDGWENIRSTSGRNFAKKWGPRWNKL